MLHSLALDHPWLFIFPDLDSDNKDGFDSVVYLVFSHNMFRPSGPDHVLAQICVVTRRIMKSLVLDQAFLLLKIHADELAL